MWLDFYMFLTLASGIALAVLGWQLCSIHIPHREDTHRLRTHVPFLPHLISFLLFLLFANCLMVEKPTVKSLQSLR